MAYNHVNNEFSQFDADNLARWTTEAYVRSINILTQRLIDEGRTSSLRRADALVGKAAAELAKHRYWEAVAAAKQAYSFVLAGARTAQVDMATPAVGANAVLGAAPVKRRYHPALDLLRGGRFCLPEAPSEASGERR